MVFVSSFLPNYLFYRQARWKYADLLTMHQPSQASLLVTYLMINHDDCQKASAVPLDFALCFRSPLRNYTTIWKYRVSAYRYTTVRENKSEEKKKVLLGRWV